MKFIVAIALLSLVYACSEDPKEKETVMDTSRIIINAQGLSFAQLPDSIKIKSSDGYVVKSLGEQEEVIDKEKGYYLKLVVNNQLLAEASDDHGMWKRTDLLDSTRPQRLYGKYQNCPYLYTASNELIPFTRKHEGYNLVSVARTSNVDTSYWGPLKEMPVRLVLYCSSIDSTANFPNIKL